MSRESTHAAAQNRHRGDDPVLWWFGIPAGEFNESSGASRRVGTTDAAETCRGGDSGGGRASTGRPPIAANCGVANKLGEFRHG